MTLTLAEAMVSSLQVVTVGYTAPPSNPLRDSDNAMNPVPEFTSPVGDQYHHRHDEPA